MLQWKEQGIEIIPFSPLADEPPSNLADLCWLSGGYPELYCKQLYQNTNFINGLREFAKTKPIHGECGGYMVLGDAIIDAEGQECKMAGLLPITTSFAKRKLHLGYRSIKLAVDLPFAQKGALIRGHEFHYSSITNQSPATSIGEMFDANISPIGSAGIKNGNVTGSFFHFVGL